MGLKYAICSEIFQGWDLQRICSTVKPMGYDGLEIAHFHLFESVEAVSPAERAEMRRIIEGEGLVCSGLHWLLVSPKGFHITTRDAEVRRRSWAYLDKLIDFCGDLGGPVMILGSPFQRSASGEMTIEECNSRLIEGLAGLAPHAAERNVTLLMEAIPSRETNVVNTLAEAAAIVRAVRHPAVQAMFDTHNTADETEPMVELLARHYPIIRHVHVNEMDGRYPGTGEIDFAPILRFLREQNYPGWVSLEVFDFKPGGEKIAREAIEHLRAAERTDAA
jgi:D-psicose/D-tagatose/L-ribulose 3-epimerase